VALRRRGFVDLPPHAGAGGFDHAAVHGPSGRIYVAHTANDAVDVIDLAGALVVDAPDLVVTSNRGEDTIGLFPPDGVAVDKVTVGVRPNGLAYDSRRGRVLVAHVGDPAVAGSCTVSIVDVRARKVVADLPVAGRTRWAVYDPIADAFHVNIADPPQIVVVDAGDPVRVRRVVPIPRAGPHGLDIDVPSRRLFCACDAGVLLEVDADSGAVRAMEPIAGVPDVVFFNPGLGRLYVAIGDPGVIEVFATAPLGRRETLPTEKGAHTLAFDARRNVVCAFLPATHRVAVYHDEG
jgi:DNA-binding beta-propeller fold protein YncE